ncbi:hypothetical protein [Halobacillus sp. BBL2006]|uniref:hypothetical protein n=1 Tax=Halobacillus sp. BBL2006 TaxID=1543706 RepID=UPI0005443411|nr:hypothetical protein [Halobacillus sp. BBL2006]KHE73174.1 hypothetical protein LD39_00895 [Halobacillus sp. BBL2006]
MSKGVAKRHLGEIRFGKKVEHFDRSVKTYKMPEEERRKRMNINPLNYIELKEEGLTDSTIAKRWGIHPPQLSQKKSKWDFTGKSLEEMKKIARKHTTKTQRQEAHASNMKQQIKEDVQEKEAEKEVAAPVEKNDRALQQKQEEIEKLLEELEQLNEDMEKSKIGLQRYEGLSKDYETLKVQHENLKEQYVQLEEQAIPKQTSILMQKELEAEREKTKKAEEEWERAKRIIQNQISEINDLTDNNERMHQKYREALKKHDTLAAYTQLVMSS